MLRKILLLIAFCLSIASVYAQSAREEGNTAYAYNRTDGSLATFNLDEFSQFASLHSIGVNVKAGAFVEGSYYAYVEGESSSQLVAYDLETGNSEVVMDNVPVMNDLTYDYTTQSLLFIQYDYPDCYLSQLNLGSKESTVLSRLEPSQFAIAANLWGEVFMADLSGVIYKIDRETYEMTEVAETGHYANTAALRSLDFDMNTGKLYFLVNGSWAGTYLFEIDTEAGTSTAVGSMQSNLYAGIYTGYTKATPKSPAAPTGLTIIPAADGSNSCELQWTCPTTAFNRSSIGSLTHATIYRNGEAVGTVDDVTAGQTATYTDNVPQAGNYTYKVTLSNGEGEGMFALAQDYVGKDVPAAPTGVTATATGSTITVSWTAPTTGQNGGALEGEITYKVVRNDDKVISESTTATQVTDEVSGAWAGYIYSVTAINAGGEGGSAQSNAVQAGEPLKLPIESALTTENDLAQWTIVDGNADGNTWHIGNLWTGNPGVEFRRNPVSTGEADEWLISPPVKLAAGELSLVTFKVSCSYSPTETLEVRIAPVGTAPEDASAIDTLTIKGSEAYYGGYDASVPVQVDTEGDYRIYLHYDVEGAYSSNEGLHITNFKWGSNNVATVSGTVNYGNDYMSFPCMGATVTMGEYKTSTDYSGKYTFTDVPAGEYDIAAEYIAGYSRETQHVVLNAGDNITVDFKLRMLSRYTVSGTVTDTEGNPISGARVDAGDGDYVTTEADGAYSLSLYEGDQTLTITKNFYFEQSKEISLTANMPGTDFALDLNVLPPYSVTATDGDEIAVAWERPQPLVELKYDNGEAVDSYGYGSYYTGSQIVGTIYVGEYTIYELKWQTTGSIDNNITLMLLGTDYGGNPTGEVLYQANVTTVDGEWNTHRLAEPFHVESGFIFAIAGQTYVATDGGTEDGEIDHPETQVYTNTYMSGTSYNYFDDLSSGQSRHFLLRASYAYDEPEDATVPAMTYTAWRLPASARDDESQWTQLATGSTELTYTDNNVPSGEYLYAVKTTYSNGVTSPATFSSIVAHNMIAAVTVNVGANSDPSHADGAKVTLYNDDNTYTAIVNGGKAEFANVEKGIYSIVIRHNGFDYIEDGGLNISGEDVAFSFDYELTQSLDLPANLDVLIDGTSARLVWNMQPNIIDNFDGDDYTDFELNPAGRAGWQYIDNDGLNTWGFASTTFPHMGEPMAAIAFNSKATTPPLGSSPLFNTAYSGTRALAFIAARGTTGTEIVESDDYMISTELKPYRDFKFRFRACTYEENDGYRERIRVGYSTTTPELDQFKWFDDTLRYVPLTYTLYEYTIPQEAKYVVLNSSSLQNFILFVDDVFIGVDEQVVGNSYMPVNVNSYEVYLDDAKVADTQDTEYLFTGLANGTHTAAVVQKFDTGDSEPLEITFSIGSTGIDGISDDANVVAIYAAGSTLHITGDYSHAVVYNTAGAQVMSLTGEPQADLSALPGGIYIVKVIKADGETVTAKVIL